MRTIILFIIFLTSCIISHARIGESPTKCEQRYGRPVDSSVRTKGLMPLITHDFRNTYKVDNIVIHVTFRKNKAVRIHYESLPEDRFDEVMLNNINKTFAEYTEAENKFKYAAELYKKELGKYDTDTGFIVEANTNGKGTLIITSADYLKYIDAEKAKAASRSTNRL